MFRPLAGQLESPLVLLPNKLEDVKARSIPLGKICIFA
jgi:hypothetical protein